MSEVLETTVDKFTFKVPTDRSYSREGLWAQDLGGRVRIGLTDFLQQRSGDVAFAEVKPSGTPLKVGDEVATVETIKVNISLASPVSGRVLEANPQLKTASELINQDPYGAGWLAVIEPTDWSKEKTALLDPQAYFNLMRRQAEEETKKP